MSEVKLFGGEVNLTLRDMLARLPWRTKQYACKVYLNDRRYVYISKQPVKDADGKWQWPERGRTMVRYAECQPGPAKIDRRARRAKRTRAERITYPRASHVDAVPSA